MAFYFIFLIPNLFTVYSHELKFITNEEKGIGNVTVDKD